MKKGYHIIFAFLLGITLANCNKDTEGDLEIDSEFCKQMTDTSGLNLYYFTPFTEHEWKYESYDYKVQRRQLPEQVLKSLTLEQLLLQCVWLDMASDMLVFNSFQAGFMSVYGRFNCVQELYKRDGIHYFLEEKLRVIDVRDMTGGEKCSFYNRFLEYVFVQKECLSLYNENEMLDCLDLIFKKVERLAFLTTLESPHYTSVGLSPWMLGIGNILIMYEYKPFLDELEIDSELKAFIDGKINANANVIIKVSKFGTEFYNKNKK